VDDCLLISTNFVDTAPDAAWARLNHVLVEAGLEPRHTRNIATMHRHGAKAMISRAMAAQGVEPRSHTAWTACSTSFLPITKPYRRGFARLKTRHGAGGKTQLAAVAQRWPSHKQATRASSEQAARYVAAVRQIRSDVGA